MINAGASGFLVCRAEFIHGDGSRVKRTKSASPVAWRPQRSAVVFAALFAPPRAPISAAVSLSHQDAMRIGRKIWQNECGGTVAGLTSWNAGENFASLGIGHFIWYPAGARGPFEESFPQFVRYVANGGAQNLPQLLGSERSNACPWNSRAEFLEAESSPKMKQLRIFLATRSILQAEFLVERLQRGAAENARRRAGRGTRARSRSSSIGVASQRAGMLRAD